MQKLKLIRYWKSYNQIIFVLQLTFKIINSILFSHDTYDMIVWLRMSIEFDLFFEWSTPWSQQYERFWSMRSCNYKFCSFNATLMLETLRGKRMMFVGDSLNRGQYVSMVCLLHRLLPEESKSMKTKGSLTIFTAKVTLN